MESRQSTSLVQRKAKNGPLPVYEPASYPSWPTSHPGPLVVQPGVGERPVNELRPEQMMEVGYNQETGEPAAQDASRY
ncbi:MAG: hypothetical protein E6J34_16475 [Chloroflexi bacterium]|nr:MAG: hypothetical protein E6J34_16475 [Chloroflexota bacterium]